MAIERWRPFAGMSEWDPFRTVADMQTEMNRLFDRFFGRPVAGTAASAAARFWVPMVDVWETKDDLMLAVEIPGVKEKDVTLSITGDVLTIRGERRADQERKEGQYYLLERLYGKFERNIQLPVPVQADKVTATYRDGVLEVRLPKAEEVKPREIKIDVV